MTEKLGFSGRVARLFLDSELTPLLGLTALLLGLFAVAVTPREEEPQINVTMANVIVPFPGASAEQVESLVATPMERAVLASGQTMAPPSKVVNTLVAWKLATERSP